MSPFLSAVLSVVIGSALTLFISWRIQVHQLRESESRADPSLNIDVVAKVLNIGGAERILEVRVEVKNNSRKTCCIPAVYVSARALAGGRAEGPYTGESDFENSLKDCGTLSEVRNVARMENTVLQVAPDEVERFVRWDTLDEGLLKQYRVLVVNVEVFSASADRIGERRFKYKRGKDRLAWIHYMNEDGGARNRYVVFGRWPVDAPDSPPLRPGRRYLRLEDGSPDLKNTKAFKKVLSTVVKWNRHTTVNLSRVTDAAPKQSSDGSPAAPATP